MANGDLTAKQGSICHPHFCFLHHHILLSLDTLKVACSITELDSDYDGYNESSKLQQRTGSDDGLLRFDIIGPNCLQFFHILVSLQRWREAPEVTLQVNLNQLVHEVRTHEGGDSFNM